MTNENKERMLELLSDQAIFELNEEEVIELEQLKNKFPDWVDSKSFELTMAAIGLSDLKIVEMPEKLRAKILSNADAHFSAEVTPNKFTNFETENNRVFGSANTETVEITRLDAEKRPFWQWFGWGVAAVACLLLAVSLWMPRFQPQTEVAKENKPIQTSTPELSIIQKRDQLIAAAPDIVRTKLEPPKGDKEISGDVVWSNSLQKGYVTFRGLPANNPAKETYQLWIFDETQNDKYPISGGVFDVNENGEVIVPINAELKIKKPKMFALTEEKPGGVVVSDREKLVAIAKI